MKKKSVSLVFMLFGLATLLVSGKSVNLELKQVLELGRGELLFESIVSLCEDKEENFYVLDRKAYKVYKFSPTGKLLLSFGNRGKGPGDFAYPHHITMTPDGKIAVSEDTAFVHFFDKSGRFVDRMKVAKGLELTYINDNLFYAWQWRPKSKQQLLIDAQGKIVAALFEVDREQFSVSAPDETGRQVMSSYWWGEYTPFFLFSQSRNRIALAQSSEYKILLLNEKGKVVKEIGRRVTPGPISAKEKNYFKGLLNEQRNLYDFAKKAFAKKIPKFKNHFDKILISEKYLFVTRIKADVTAEHDPIPVDLFSLDGEFLGTSALPLQPIYISDRSIYAVKEEEDELLLIKYFYYIIKYS